MNLSQELLKILPEHKCSLTIEHNPHKDVYETVKYMLDLNDVYDWPYESEKQEAIENDDVWFLQWYPQTPVGFHALAFSSLESMIRYLQNDYNKD